MINKINWATCWLWLTRLLALGLFALISNGWHLPLPHSAPQALDFYGLGRDTLVACVAAWLGCYLVLQYDHLHAHVSHDHDLNGIQKIHAHPVPRIGGLALLFGLLMALCTLAVTSTGHRFSVDLLWLLVAALPVFITGLWEDLTKRVSVLQRLLASFISAELAIVLCQALIPNIGLPWLDGYLIGGPVLLLLTIIGSGGVTHSYNLIDGMNGLLAGFTLILLAALLSVAVLVGDGVILAMGGCLFGATLGFLVWNWPRGLLFLGDGGAYLLGFLSATLLILLVARHPQVSPWLPLVLVGYPVMETLFSAYRRIYFNGQRHDAPDNQHLHQLVYQWICRERQPHHGAHISSNSLTALPILAGVVFVTVFAVYWYDNTQALVAVFLGGVIFYMVLYRSLYFVVFRLLLKRHHAS